MIVIEAELCCQVRWKANVEAVWLRPEHVVAGECQMEVQDASPAPVEGLVIYRVASPVSWHLC